MANKQYSVGDYFNKPGRAGTLVLCTTILTSGAIFIANRITNAYVETRNNVKPTRRTSKTSKK